MPKDSDGLETWLRRNNYKLPQGAGEVLRPYIRQQMKFFVAKVNLEEFNKTGSAFCDPCKLPIDRPSSCSRSASGMLNAQGDQDLVAYLLSPKGRSRSSQLPHRRSTQRPKIRNIIKKDFGKFYTSAFQTAPTNRQTKKSAFMEYAWDVSNCDPCTTQPPTSEELKKAGVFWQAPEGREEYPTYITRLHIRYNRATFPEDLVFQETSNRENFQGRYVLNHPYRESIPVVLRQNTDR